MAYFDCIVGGSGKGNTLVVTCADELAGATITCTNGTKTYNKTCPSTSPYEVTFYGLEAGTWTVSATVSGNTYTTTVVVADIEALLGGFNWKTWVDLSDNYTSSDFTDLDDLLSDETAVRELMTIHACVDYLAGITAESANVETIIGNDFCAKWINNREYALDTLYANEIIAGYMDEADKYGYGEWALVGQVPKMTSNTAPYGEAIGSSYEGEHYYWHAFDGDKTSTTTNAFMSNTYSVNDGAYIGYTFASSQKISQVEVYSFAQSANQSQNIVVEGYDGNEWKEMSEVVTVQYSTANQIVRTVINITKNFGNYSKVRIYRTDNTYGLRLCVSALQFYAWGPKGNVPVMTSNTAPYGEAIAGTTYSGQPFSAFDGNDSTYWYPGNNADNYIGYKFTNPVCVKRFVFKFLSYAVAITPFTPKLQASNDGSNWETLWTSPQAISATGVYDIKVNNNDYYLYWRLWTGQMFVTNTSTNWIHTLQFYGRELSVSVPTMTGNTTPYGEASASTTYSTYSPYKAMDGDITTNNDWWSANGNTDEYIQYEFINPMVLKRATFIAKYIGSRMRVTKYSILASNDGFVSDIHDLTGEVALSTYTADLLVVKDIEQSNPYKQYRVKASGADNVCINGLQFFGEDYSEKEFEEGATKKWLYDHGVELENLRLNKGNEANNAIIKQNDQIILKTNYTGVDGNTNVYSVAGFENIDFTPYTLFRCAIGNQMIPVTSRYATGNVFGGLKVVTDIDIACPDGGSAYQDSATIAEIAYIDSAFFPNKITLDVSSLKSIYDVFYGLEYFSGNHEASLSELWLE